MRLLELQATKTLVFTLSAFPLFKLTFSICDHYHNKRCMWHSAFTISKIYIHSKQKRAGILLNPF
jgi:hypothetical protein